MIKKITDKEIGLKFDETKLRPALLPWEAIHAVLQVMEHGAKKYGENNWKMVDIKRYENALLRHAISYSLGEKKDLDSGMSTMAHIACNALFMLWLEITNK